MAEEIKTKEELQEEEITSVEDNDADIDQYIRELTGKTDGKKKEEPKKEREPEVEHFRVTSQIGGDDYKAFIYFNSFLRYKWLLPAFILVPAVFAGVFALMNGRSHIQSVLFGLLFIYLAIALIIVFRCQRWLSKIKKKTPKVMYLTDTTIIFLTYSILHIKNGTRTKVEYEHMTGVAESRNRFFMYFDNGKSMVFRKEDMPAEELEKFRPFIKTRVHKIKFADVAKK